MLHLQLILLLLRYLLPQLAVDPQRLLQAKAAADAGDAAAQWAAHSEEASLRLRHGFQTRLAKGVSAVEKPGDPLRASVGQEAHTTLTFLAQDHGGSGGGRPSLDPGIKDRHHLNIRCLFLFHTLSLKMVIL